MSGKWPGGFITKVAPTVVGPVDGEGGTASGIWTLDQVADYEEQGLWPKRIISKPAWAIGGYNGTKQLGLGTTTNMSSPVQIGSAVTWKTLATAWYSCMATQTDGTLWIWGDGTYGQLGNSGTANVGTPTQLGALTTWLHGGGGGYCFNMGLRSDGTLWSTGKNNYGQLGLNNTTDKSAFTQVGALTDWLKVCGTYQHTYAIKTDGTLWIWGRNFYGELGLGNTTDYSSPKQVGALTDWATIPVNGLGSKSSSFAIKTDGTLWSWGRNGYGQLGLGDATDRSSPVQVGALTTWSKIETGRQNTLAIKTDGTLWAWGEGAGGGLAQGNLLDYSSPVQVGSLTTWSVISGGQGMGSGISTDGTLWVWGMNNVGQLGLNNTTYYSSPVQVGTSTDWGIIASGQNANLALEHI